MCPRSGAVNGRRWEPTSITGGTEGQTRWYEFSTKFDPTFPQNHADLGWGVTNGWHPDSGTGSGPFQWSVGTKNGYWSLIIQKQSSPGVYLANLLDLRHAPECWTMA